MTVAVCLAAAGNSNGEARRIAMVGSRLILADSTVSEDKAMIKMNKSGKRNNVSIRVTNGSGMES